MRLIACDDPAAITSLWVVNETAWWSIASPWLHQAMTTAEPRDGLAEERSGRGTAGGTEGAEAFRRASRRIELEPVRGEIAR
jgi:hypothetical protein